MEGTLASISARNRREAMEWALVLTSQGIGSVIAREENGWKLQIEPRDFERAQSSLRQYRQENRGWNWRHAMPEANMLFHWGGVAWAAAMVVFYYWSSIRFPGISRAGMVDTEKIHEGQWWRFFTAICLHQNGAHLMANATTGGVLIGFAMARYGAGVALLASFLAGVLGNVASAFAFREPHFGLGASGMVMAALGLLAVQAFSHWPKGVFGRRTFFRGCAAGLLILALIGFDPKSDVIAHVAGFFGGALMGCGLVFIPSSRIQDGVVNAIAFSALATLLLATWRLAFIHP